MLVFARDPADLRQRPAVSASCSMTRTARRPRRQLPADLPASACSWPCSWSTASTPPGRSARRRVDASRQAPRGVLSRHLALGHRRRRSSSWRHPAFKDIAPRSPRARHSASRSRPRSTTTCRPRRDHFGEIYLFVILARRVRLHPGDPGRDDPPDVLDGPRSAPAARAASGATSIRRSRRPANAAIAVGVLAAIPFLVTGAGRPRRDRGDGHDLPQLLPVQPRRPQRPPHGLAAQGRLVQPRQLGHDHQHRSPSSGAA